MQLINYYLFYNGRIICRRLVIGEIRFTAFLILVLLVLFTGCANLPRAVYDFDDGTTQNWKAGVVADDKGTSYTSLFKESHNELAQYPNNIPGGDPDNDKKGCLFLYGYQFAAFAQKVNFPPTSAYWEVSASCTGLSNNGFTAWQGIKGIKVAIGDGYGAVPGHLTANIGVRAHIGGQEKLIREVDSGGNLLYHSINHQTTYKWSYINAKLNIPANAEVYMVFIIFRGDWANYKLYDGGIYIDQVEPVK